MAPFATFFRTHHRELIRMAMYVGANRDEADEAAQAAMTEVLQRWETLSNPSAYARKAVITYYLREKTRNLDRIRARQAKRGAGTPQGSDDAGMTVLEDREWVMQLLESLPRGQRDVVAFIFDGFSRAEIAILLGTTEGAVRQRLHDARQRLRRTLQADQNISRPGQKEGR